MSRRRLVMLHDPVRDRTAKVYRDPALDEHVVVFYQGAQRVPDGDYFTDDAADALRTAQHWIDNP